MARPTDLNEDLRRSVEHCVTSGLTVRATCALLHISPAVWYRWAARGRTELEERRDPYYPQNVTNDRYVEFVDTIESSKARALSNALETVQDFARGWQNVETMDEQQDGAKGTTTRSVTKTTTVRSWQAAAWIAERLDPENYGRTNRTVLSSDPEAPVQVTHTVEAVDVPALARVVNILADAGVFPPQLGTGDADRSEPGPDPEVDEIHPADPDPETAGVPPT